MSYVKDNLLPHEKVLFTARVHPTVFLRPLVPFLAAWCFVFLAVGLPQERAIAGGAYTGYLLGVGGLLLFVAIVFWVQALIMVRTTQFAVTNKRLIARTGLIRRRTLVMLLSKIQSVTVGQDIFGRLLDLGTLTVAGKGGAGQAFQAIRSPLTVRTEINQTIKDYA
jgi:uncharacterized membrane protein YdbT with pleckstrin-like domain